MMDGNYLFIYPLGNIDLPNYSPGIGKGRKMKTQQLSQMSKSKLQIVKPGFFTTPYWHGTNETCMNKLKTHIV